jgi:hypothetical protein
VQREQREVDRGQQKQGRIGAGDPIELAEITWAMSRGIATLGMAHQLSRTATALDDLAALGCAILVRGLRRKEVCYTARR